MDKNEVDFRAGYLQLLDRLTWDILLVEKKPLRQKIDVMASIILQLRGWFNIGNQPESVPLQESFYRLMVKAPSEISLIAAEAFYCLRADYNTMDLVNEWSDHKDWRYRRVAALIYKNQARYQEPAHLFHWASMFLLKLAKEQNTQVKIALLEALGAVSNDEIPVRYLEHKDASVRLAAVKAYAQIAVRSKDIGLREGAQDTFKCILMADKNENVRRAALDGIGAISKHETDLLAPCPG